MGKPHNGGWDLSEPDELDVDGDPDDGAARSMSHMTFKRIAKGSRRNANRQTLRSDGPPHALLEGPRPQGESWPFLASLEGPHHSNYSQGESQSDWQSMRRRKPHHSESRGSPPQRLSRDPATATGRQGTLEGPHHSDYSQGDSQPGWQSMQRGEPRHSDSGWIPPQRLSRDPATASTAGRQATVGRLGF